MTGIFIVFDGPDGSGTTKHCGMLADTLRQQGKNVLLTAEPTESPIGKEIRGLLHSDTMPSPDAVQLLFCADRANHVTNVIEPALRKGQIVLCDRYALSTIVYGMAQGVDRTWLESINEKFPKPDLTFITLPPFDVCMERIHRREKKDRFEMENFQRRVYENYRSVEDPSAIFVDTSGDKRDVANFVERQYEKHFGGISQESAVKVG